MENKMPNLTQDEFAFLKKLAIELKTQDNIATAKPLVFTIRERFPIVGYDSNYADELCLIDEEGTIFTETTDVIKYIEDHYSDSEHQTVEEIAESIGETVDEFDFYSLSHLLNALGCTCEVSYWKMGERFKGAFLTSKSAEEHLKANRHHYVEDAEVYCTHGWRNPVLEQLLSIVEKFDIE